MDKKESEILQKKIDVVIGLLTMNLPKDGTLQDRVQLLHSLNLGPKQISDILGKNEGNINKTLDRIRKKEKED